MRTFSNDAPEFFAFKIEGSKKMYKIPLAASLTTKQIRGLDESGENYYKQVEWLRQFVGDLVDDLTPNTVVDIIKAWSQESKDNGASPGESKALSE